MPTPKKPAAPEKSVEKIEKKPRTKQPEKKRS